MSVHSNILLVIKHPFCILLPRDDRCFHHVFPPLNHRAKCCSVSLATGSLVSTATHCKSTGPSNSNFFGEIDATRQHLVYSHPIIGTALLWMCVRPPGPGVAAPCRTMGVFLTFLCSWSRLKNYATRTKGYLTSRIVQNLVVTVTQRWHAGCFAGRCGVSCLAGRT